MVESARQNPGGARTPRGVADLREQIDMNKPTCSVPGCNRRHYGKSYCSAHYKRWKTSGAPGPAEIAQPQAPPRQRTCTADGCEKPLKCRGLCEMHYGRLRRAGLPDQPQSARVCSVEGCGRKHNTGGYCYTHYARFKRTGSIGATQIRERVSTVLRDSQGRKRCRLCREWKAPDNYHGSKNCADGLNPRCKRCMRNRKLVENFGITLAEYEALAAAQSGACAICGDNPDVLHVDHDHACCPEKGKSCGTCVRQLLCAWCNRGIGMFKDAPERLRAAAAYLERQHG